MLKTFNTNLEEVQIKELDAISSSTHIPKARLVRQAIDLLIDEYKNGLVSPEFTRVVDDSIAENANLLKRLANA